MLNWFRERKGFITGATGWFGRWICAALDKASASYLTLSHTKEEHIRNFRFPEQCDYIIHLAPGLVDRVIECAQEFKCPVLFTSSGAVYMNKPDEYAMRKLDNEKALLGSGISVKIARCFTFAGAGIPLGSGYALGNFIHSALIGESLKVWGSGNVIRTYMYMSDLVDWLLRILAFGDGIYEVGSEDEVTIWELARMVRACFQPRPEIIIDNKSTKERFPYYVPDTTRARSLGCEIRVGTEEAIRKTCKYYQENYYEE